MYASFVERARRAGVHIPIVPGILPATDPARLRRVQDLTGIEVPEQLLSTLAGYQHQEQRDAFGAGFWLQTDPLGFGGGRPRRVTYTPSTRPNRY